MKHPNVTFYPWTGKNYNVTGFRDKKVMLLGESHYGDPATREKDLTINTVEMYLERKEPPTQLNNWKSFFSKITRICLDKSEISKEDRDSFWDSVVFYNYVAECLKKNCRPNNAQWEKSEANFYKVLGFYRPDVVLVIGDSLWEHTPNKDWTKVKLNLGYYLLKDGHKVFASSIYHPSARGLSYGNKNFNSKTVFKKLLEACEAKGDV